MLPLRRFLLFRDLAGDCLCLLTPLNTASSFRRVGQASSARLKLVGTDLDQVVNVGDVCFSRRRNLFMEAFFGSSQSL